jgi:site-specific recombinase XerD
VDIGVVAPSDGGEVWQFARYCWDVRGVAASTLEGYVSSAVKYARVMQGRLLVVPQLYRDWMARLKQLPVTSHAKQPVSRQFMLELVSRTRTSLATRVAAIMCYFTGMRLGELVASKVAEYDPMFTVTRGDIHFDPEMRFVKFTNKGGKSDVLNRGTERYLMAAGDGAVFCPVKFLRQLWDLNLGAPADKPFLQHADGKMVTRRHVVDLLKRVAADLGIDPASVAGHTLRISAATHLAEEGVAMSEIQIFGGWLTPEVCMRYLRWTDARLQRMSKALTLRPGPVRASQILGMVMAVEEPEVPEV